MTSDEIEARVREVEGRMPGAFVTADDIRWLLSTVRELRRELDRAVKHSTEMESRAWKCEHERDEARKPTAAMREALEEAKGFALQVMVDIDQLTATGRQSAIDATFEHAKERLGFFENALKSDAGSDFVSRAELAKTGMRPVLEEMAAILREKARREQVARETASTVAPGDCSHSRAGQTVTPGSGRVPMPDFPDGAGQTFREFIGGIIGEASMCWSTPPAGTFRSDRAVQLIDRACAMIDCDSVPVSREVLRQVAGALKSAARVFEGHPATRGVLGESFRLRFALAALPNVEGE